MTYIAQDDAVVDADIAMPLWWCCLGGLSPNPLRRAYSLFTICGDACPLSCVIAEACLTGWPNARDRRDGGS